MLAVWWSFTGFTLLYVFCRSFSILPTGLLLCFYIVYIMKILITNDDGVTSNGILAVREAVSEFGECTIVAPLTQQSGVGHAITLMKPLRAVPTVLEEDIMAYGVTGTPTDSLIVGALEIMDEKPDLLISGINVGENLSCTITTSGTLGATFEAASLGIPSIAVSLQIDREDLKFRNGVQDIDYSFAIKVLHNVVEKFVERGMPDGVSILNLNIPYNPKSGEVIQSYLANRMYTTGVEKRIDPFGHPYYWIVGDLVDDEEHGSDVHTLRVLNHPTITALSTNLGVDVDLGDWLD